MTKTKKICFSLIIMLILAILIVCFVNFFLPKEPKTYEGILVKQEIEMEDMLG